MSFSVDSAGHTWKGAFLRACEQAAECARFSGNNACPGLQRTEVPNPEAYTITFRDDGTLSGQADCNSYTGTYSTDGGFFIASTPDVMAACGGDSLDQQYFELLDAVAAGGPDGAGGLALETAGGEQRMTFVNLSLIHI